MKLPLLALGVVVVSLMGPAQAQTLLSVKAEPASAKTGEAVKISAQFDLSKAQNCNVRIHFGDGTTTDARINQEKDANLVLSHAYDKAGSYTVMVEPKTKLPTLKCTGGNEKTVVTITASASHVRPSAAATVQARVSSSQSHAATSTPKVISRSTPKSWATPRT